MKLSKLLQETKLGSLTSFAYSPLFDFTMVIILLLQFLVNEDKYCTASLSITSPLQILGFICIIRFFSFFIQSTAHCFKLYLFY